MIPIECVGCAVDHFSHLRLGLRWIVPGGVALEDYGIKKSFLGGAGSWARKNSEYAAQNKLFF